MATSPTPDLFVVDGSNIATEGRSTPSLEQLNDAVLAFLEDRPGVRVTVVVDATFGHRIDKKEARAFDEAVANNELVTPPAGAVGRGDAFVLSIAHKAKAGVLSNDSFQEFHGEYDWLFDEGRLVGGKPVPHVGWVFVDRTPVRGPKSRQAVREAKEDATETKERANRRVRKKAAAAEPVAESAPDRSDAASGRSRRGRRRRGGDKVGPEQQATIEAAKAAGGREQVNELVPFLEFVEKHPVGTSCTGVVESYASHGAYARVDDVLIYIPLRLMDDPPPRSARSVLKTGEAVAMVIVGYVPDRRSVDAALPHMATDGETPVEPGTVSERPAADRARASTADEQGPAVSETPAKQSARKAPAKKAVAKQAPAKKTAATKTPAKKAAATKAPAKKTAAKQASAAKATAKRTAASRGRAPADRETTGETTGEATATTTTIEAPSTAPPEQATAKKSTAKEAPAKKTTAKKTTAKKTTAKQTTAKKTTATRTTAKQAPAKKAAAKRAPAKKATAKKAPAKKTVTKRSGSAAEKSATSSSATSSSAKQSTEPAPAATRGRASAPTDGRPSDGPAPETHATPARRSRRSGGRRSRSGGGSDET